MYLNNKDPWSNGKHIHLLTWRLCVWIPAEPISPFFPQKTRQKVKKYVAMKACAKYKSRVTNLILI